jgi:hypothetical protein
MGSTFFHETKEKRPIYLYPKASSVSKVKKIILKFEDWLNDQQYREDSIGDLARLPSIQNIEPSISKRKLDEHKDWADTIIRMDQPGYIFVFNEAWQEFLLAKQAAEDASD